MSNKDDLYTEEDNYLNASSKRIRTSPVMGIPSRDDHQVPSGSPNSLEVDRSSQESLDLDEFNDEINQGINHSFDHDDPSGYTEIQDVQVSNSLGSIVRHTDNTNC